MHGLIFEALLESGKGLPRAGDDEKAAGVSVEAVDNAGTIGIANSCYFRIVSEYPLYNCAGFSGA